MDRLFQTLHQAALVLLTVIGLASLSYFLFFAIAWHGWQIASSALVLAYGLHELWKRR